MVVESFPLKIGTKNPEKYTEIIYINILYPTSKS